jgi:hypothetical protein
VLRTTLHWQPAACQPHQQRSGSPQTGRCKGSDCLLGCGGAPSGFPSTAAGVTTLDCASAGGGDGLFASRCYTLSLPCPHCPARQHFEPCTGVSRQRPQIRNLSRPPYETAGERPCSWPLKAVGNPSWPDRARTGPQLLAVRSIMTACVTALPAVNRPSAVGQGIGELRCRDRWQSSSGRRSG